MALAAAEFRFTLNGESVTVAGMPPQTNLLDYVRGRGLTGAKEGCAEGECGACAMLVVGGCMNVPGRQSVYRVVNSCLVPLPAVAGQEVWTVESLAPRGGMAEVQRAMSERGGSQCGYCTPGFIVSMFAAQYGGQAGSDAAHALGGNLCRCTGYRPIGDAFASLGPPPEGFFLNRLTQPAPTIDQLRYEIPAGCFSRPCGLGACFEIAATDSAAEFVGGNTDLGVMTNLHDRRFPHLVSLEGIPELREFREDQETVHIGAGLTLTEIGERWRSAPLIFREWLELFASPLIRNRATLGGNLATASPIGDAAPMLIALDSQLVLASSEGDRVVPLREFFTGYRKTALRHGEIIRSVRIPKPLPARARFYKVAKRALDDISTVAAGIASVDGRLRIGFGGVAPTPLSLLIKPGTDVRDYIKPIGDHRGSAEYRLAVSQSLIAKFAAEEK